ncbi:hypothetical protein CABS01_16450 [Colletotrichum abscissum]|uniref:uncharacterized protein n=1 Tax=Colletotrichum abscissum TaxID=1671311 RepID=UPI0027D59615|nr:uncharacterized protein CABS01_16450 [Colletotrichum abscissum]KAK1471188.1 hypothetical protein CABS01_16450 [Colletotrichum abscissum]
MLDRIGGCMALEGLFELESLFKGSFEPSSLKMMLRYLTSAGGCPSVGSAVGTEVLPDDQPFSCRLLFGLISVEDAVDAPLEADADDSKN